MGKIFIHLVGTLRTEFNGATIEVKTEGRIPFRRLLNLVHAQTGRDLAPVVCHPDTGELLPTMAIFVNNVNIRQQQGLDTPMRDGDAVMIMRADMAGG